MFKELDEFTSAIKRLAHAENARAEADKERARSEHYLGESIRLLADAISDRHDHHTQLSRIAIQFQKGANMAAVIGPVTLNVGSTATASVQGFDQTGQPMPADFVMPQISYTDDNAAVASSTPDPATSGQTSAILALTAGVANLTASLTTAEGLALTDTEAITVSPVVAPPPVLTTIKLAFDTGAPGAAQAAARR